MKKQILVALVLTGSFCVLAQQALQPQKSVEQILNEEFKKGASACITAFRNEGHVELAQHIQTIRNESISNHMPALMQTSIINEANEAIQKEQRALQEAKANPAQASKIRLIEQKITDLEKMKSTPIDEVIYEYRENNFLECIIALRKYSTTPRSEHKKPLTEQEHNEEVYKKFKEFLSRQRFFENFMRKACNYDGSEKYLETFEQWLRS